MFSVTKDTTAAEIKKNLGKKKGMEVIKAALEAQGFEPAYCRTPQSNDKFVNELVVQIDEVTLANGAVVPLYLRINPVVPYFEKTVTKNAEYEPYDFAEAKARYEAWEIQKAEEAAIKANTK